MASTNFTTHYSIPLPLGTDLTTPMDYNEAAEAVDAALFAAETDAGNASEAAAAAVTTANAATEEVDTLGTDLSQEKAKIEALQTRVTNAENEIDDVRTDASDMITAYNEPTATASHAYAIGDFFIYNNTLYKATAAIAIGATIVPDTNCETTNVSTELIEIKSDLSNKVISVTGNGVKTLAQILTEIKAALGANVLNHNSRIEVTGTSYNSIFECVDSGIGIFNRVIGSETNATITTIRLDDTTWRNVILDSTPSITINDISSSVADTSTTVKLYYV